VKLNSDGHVIEVCSTNLPVTRSLRVWCKFGRFVQFIYCRWRARLPMPVTYRKIWKWNVVVIETVCRLIVTGMFLERPPRTCPSPVVCGFGASLVGLCSLFTAGDGQDSNTK